ncbi:MAG: hypothetical protein RMK20_13505 [Verrucomicrobiales bacterium]|nr:hypothetical protein [Verrucomicrobiales bacterium]
MLRLAREVEPARVPEVHANPNRRFDSTSGTGRALPTGHLALRDSKRSSTTGGHSAGHKLLVR